MSSEMSFLEKAKDLRSKADPQYAKDRPKNDTVLALILLRKNLGLSQSEVAQRMGVPNSRLSELESKPWNATWDRIHAYAGALGARLVLHLPDSSEEFDTNPVAAAKLQEINDKVLELARILQHS